MEKSHNYAKLLKNSDYEYSIVSEPTSDVFASLIIIHHAYDFSEWKEWR